MKGLVEHDARDADRDGPIGLDRARHRASDHGHAAGLMGGQRRPAAPEGRVAQADLDAHPLALDHDVAGGGRHLELDVGAAEAGQHQHVSLRWAGAAERVLHDRQRGLGDRLGHVDADLERALEVGRGRLL
ncbi:MAG: hypothetical protein K8H88_08535, partial [Sandaracinaceae bacterium]|nr:hypothetical protein [Sandaracinaceae bacterium]